jgi:hypothetical protein
MCLTGPLSRVPHTIFKIAFSCLQIGQILMSLNGPLKMAAKRVNNLESGQATPNMEDLVSITEFFDIRLGDLLDTKLSLAIPSRISNNEI